MDIDAVLTSLSEKLSGWIEALIIMLPNFVAAIAIVVVAALVARWARRLAHHALDRVSNYGQVNSLISTIIYAGVMIAGVFIALGVVNLDRTVATLLAGIGILGLALGFAFQDIAENFIAGVMMAFRRPLQVGDIVETNDFFGTVHEVNLRTTIVRTFQGKHVLIPNKDVYSSSLVNYSRGSDLRVDLECGVAYGDDLEQAERIAKQALSDLPMRDKTRDVELFWDSFGDSSINFVVQFWITYRVHSDFLRARSEAVKRLKAAFDESGVTIPFPIRTLDFGVVGGEKLSEVLPPRFYAESGNQSGQSSRDT